MISVLVLSAVEAYRIQASASQQQLEIYRSYVDQESTLSILRRNLWLAGNDIRDFFISTTPQQAAILREQMETLGQEDEATLKHMERSPQLVVTAATLRKSLGEFWTMAAPVPDTMLNVSDEGKFQFLQQVVVPRRGQLYTALVDLTAADQQKLQVSEREFADTRRAAAERLLIMLVLSVLLAVVVAKLSIGHAENLESQAEEHLAAVEQTRRELQQLSARHLEVEEEGRRRLSRELHDEIGQTLALLQIEISHTQAALTNAPQSVGERLTRARSLAERTVQTIRNMAGLLRPALLDDLGLVPALQFQLEDFLRRSRIPCEFVEEGVADQLPDAVKTCVYRVVQEALHNCEKHSGASRIRVAVRQLPDGLVAEIEDNGCGFQMNEQRMPYRARGLGLLGMRERAANAGGTLIIDSAPGHGTRIALRIPLQADRTPHPPVEREVNA
ncbi:MAG TPA: sensor histidine kinase [Candidatus Sulfopaludibacter sp.]|nr:sensor histidine kinase [Candidatus Sulfopaludibacter sp.]